MTHPRVEEVSEHLEGLLPPEDDRRVREHLAGCARCSATVDALARVTARLQAAAAEVPPIPADVDARVREAVAAESRQRRGSDGEPVTEPVAGPVPESEVYAGSGVADLARHRRRRRALAGGLLAAAAVTVVAAGLGGLLGPGGLSGGLSGGGEQAGSAVAERSAADQAVPPAGRPEVAGRPPEARLDEAAPGRRPGPDSTANLREGRRFSGDDLRRDRRLRAAGVAQVESVADRHRAGTPRAERTACVRSALDDDAAGTAAYAVRLPRGYGSGPGAVVLRPGDTPTIGLLVDCSPRPRVLLRHRLRP